MLATTQLWAIADRGLAPTASIPSISEMPAPQAGSKCQCYSSDQGVPTLRQNEEEMVDIDDMLKECPHHKQKEGRLAVKALREPHHEAFSKELDVVKAVRWAYYEAHQANFEQEGLHDLFSIFWQMATFTHLLGTEVHEVWESWGSQKDLQTVN